MVVPVMIALLALMFLYAGIHDVSVTDALRSLLGRSPKGKLGSFGPAASSGGGSSSLTGGAAGSSIGSAAGGDVQFAPDARVGLVPDILNTLSEASAGIGHLLYVGTGKLHHSVTTVNGNISEHSTGHAADLIASNSGLTNEQLGQQLYTFFTGNTNPPAGGLFNIPWQGHRIQLIYQTMEGGNHYTHVHVGIK
jgi:hypothetical protein